MTRPLKRPITKVSLIAWPVQCSGDSISGEIMAYEGFMLVLFGSVIVVQQFIIYLMYVRIRQLLNEIDAIEGKIRITDTELENLISRVEEFKRGNI
jgi:cell division protein FtsL